LTLDSKGNNRQHLQHLIFLVTSSFAATLQARNQKIESTSWFLNHLDVFTLKIVFAHLIFKRISLK